MFLNQYLPEKGSLEGKYTILKNIKFPRGNYQSDSSETLTPCCPNCSPLNFLPRGSSKIILNYFNVKIGKKNIKEKRKQTRTHVIQFQLSILYRSPLVYRKNSHDTTSIDPIVLFRQALFKQYSVSVEKLSADSNAPQKFDVLETNICPISEASRANMLVLRTSNFQGATIRPIVSIHKDCIAFIVHH